MLLHHTCQALKDKNYLLNTASIFLQTTKTQGKYWS